MKVREEQLTELTRGYEEQLARLRDEAGRTAGDLQVGGGGEGRGGEGARLVACRWRGGGGTAMVSPMTMPEHGLISFGHQIWSDAGS